MRKAAFYYQMARNQFPRKEAVLNNLGVVYLRLKQYRQAIDVFNEMVAQRPDIAEGHFNLGSAYRLVNQFKQAAMHLAQAVRLKPADANAWNNLALVCKNMGDLNRALSYFNRALQIDGDLAIAHWNRSFINLLQGDWQNGWRDFEWRFKIPEWQTIYPFRIQGTLWQGEVLPEQTLLVHDEQGLGDTIQFVRYLPRVKERCARVVLETRKELAPLLAECPGIDSIITRSTQGPPAIPYDRYVSLLSLPRIFGTTPDCVPSPSQYLTAPAVKRNQWQKRLAPNRFKVGLVWSGNPGHSNDTNRSCSLNQFSPLFELKNMAFIGLQKGPAACGQNLRTGWSNFRNLGSELEDFSDTAGLLANLDLMISVDTSVAHLAGALGRPVWVLIPFIPDWRWMLNTVGSSWYPTMRLFRQSRPYDWETVIANIKNALIEEYQRHGARP